MPDTGIVPALITPWRSMMPLDPRRPNQRMGITFSVLSIRDVPDKQMATRNIGDCGHWRRRGFTANGRRPRASQARVAEGRFLRAHSETAAPPGIAEVPHHDVALPVQHPVMIERHLAVALGTVSISFDTGICPLSTGRLSCVPSRPIPVVLTTFGTARPVSPVASWTKSTKVKQCLVPPIPLGLA